MNRAPNNYHHGAGSGGSGGSSGVHIRFGGTGDLSNYDSVSGSHAAHEGNPSSSNCGDGSFNRSYDNSGNRGKSTNFGHNRYTAMNNQRDDHFQKFRDQYARDRYGPYNVHKRKKFSGERGGNGGRFGPKQHYGNGGSKNPNNGHVDHGTTAPVQNDKPPTAVKSPAPGADLQNVAQVIQTVENYQAVPPPIETNLSEVMEAKKPIIKNIKQEKIEQKNSKRIDTTKSSSSSSSSESSESEAESSVKPVPEVVMKDKNPIRKNIKQEKIEQKNSKHIDTTKSSSSSSSSESSESEAESSVKPVLEVVTQKLVADKHVSSGNPIQKNVSPSSSSSSSSSSEEEENINKAKNNAAMPPKATKEIVAENLKEPTKKKQSSEDDVICLGKLEKKFVIEDDASEEAEQEICETENVQCLICDNQGHTAFECQMICKNCSAPYHNMKTCPKPANLSIMMQSFMDFCMGQMSQFNPEQKFLFPTNYKANENTLTGKNLHMGNEVQSKKVKKTRAKSKEIHKKLTKRKRRRTTKSSDEEEDEDEEQEETSSDSESESGSSDVVATPKSKKKRRKAPASVNSSDFRNSFVPNYSTFPAFGAAAAAYNPLLLGQLMHSGGFGTLK